MKRAVDGRDGGTSSALCGEHEPGRQRHSLSHLCVFCEPRRWPPCPERSSQGCSSSSGLRDRDSASWGQLGVGFLVRVIKIPPLSAAKLGWFAIDSYKTKIS